MYKLTKQDDDTVYNLCEFVADDLSDVASLPTEVSPGSTCIVVATASVYMLNNKGEWKEL